MFLFTKKTKNVVKWFWIVFATLIMLSMVFTYSGFTMLARTQTPQPQELTPEILAQLQDEQGSTTPEMQALIDQLNASSTVVELTDESIEREDTPEPEPTQPPVPQLDFSL